MTELTFIEVCSDVPAAADTLVLPFEARQKTRQRIRLATGRQAGLKLPRGTVLRGGDVVRSQNGTTAVVVAAAESVSTVTAADPVSLARAAYHLGNRHVWLEVGQGWLRYLADPVLDEMVRNLGVDVISEEAPFEPEAGAYAAHERPGREHAHAHHHPGVEPHDH